MVHTGHLQKRKNCKLTTKGSSVIATGGNFKKCLELGPSL